MSTPVLTKKQQRQSLSAKKGPMKGLRNVLAQPHETYWPILNAEQCPALETVLKEVTLVLRKPARLIKWSKLRQMKKEERQKAKREALASQSSLPDKNIVSAVVTGINAVTRSVEKNNVCCILLDSKVEPLLLVKHIVTMAQNKNIPVILIPFLKNITEISMGFACAAFALKNLIVEDNDHHFNRLYKEILNASTMLAPPKQSLRLFTADSTDGSDMSSEDTENSDVNESKICSEETKSFTISSNVYKYRSSKTERAFIPPSTVQKEDDIKETEKTSGDFIKLESDSDSMECDAETKRAIKKGRYVDIKRNKTKRPDYTKKTRTEPNDSENKRKGPEVTYLSLKVKRVQGNSNRVKATKTSEKKKK